MPTQTDETAIRQIFASRITDITTYVSEIVPHAVVHAASEFKDSSHTETDLEEDPLFQQAANEFHEVCKDWIEFKIAKLRGPLIDEGLKILSELDSPQLTAKRNDEDEAADNDGSHSNGAAAASLLARPKATKRKGPGPNEVRLTANVPQRNVVAFLKSHGFSRISTRTGELSFRHDSSGGKVSIPHHGHGRDLRASTARRILRQIGEILSCDVGVVRGKVMIVNNDDLTKDDDGLRGGLNY